MQVINSIKKLNYKKEVGIEVQWPESTGKINIF